MERLAIRKPEYGIVVLINKAIDGFEYEIPENELIEVRSLCNWIRHISEKNWVTKEHIKELCEIAHSIDFEIRHPI